MPPKIHYWKHNNIYRFFGESLYILDRARIVLLFLLSSMIWLSNVCKIRFSSTWKIKLKYTKWSIRNVNKLACLSSDSSLFLFCGSKNEHKI